MYIIIPVCGFGTRFFPKEKIIYPVIDIPLLCWILNSLNFSNIIVTYRDNIDIDIIKKSFNKIIFYPITSTLGAAETVFKTIDNFKDRLEGHSILSIDGDNIWDFSKNIKFEGNNCYYTKITNNSGIYSTLKIKKGKLINIQEKTGSTNNICVGAYQFDNIDTFYKAYDLTFGLLPNNGEYYLSKMFNNIPNVKCIEVDDFWCLGTPKQIEVFTHFYLHRKPRNLLISEKIATDDNIDFLKSKEHKIYMKCSNIEDSNRIRNMGVDCFYKFGDKIDFYLEDIYKTSYDCRYFHKIVINNGKFKKFGDNLYSQSSFYHNIEERFSKYFPKIYSPISSKKIVLEEIKGLSFSHLYLKKLLTPEDLLNMCIIINNFHESVCSESFQIDNYGKIYSRVCHENYNHIDYSETLNKFETFYKNYKSKYLCFIHGDPILSNILVDNKNSIFFIDPRGSYFNGREITSIYGDPNYDWAKLYQSLTGYEEIISGKTVTKNYKNNMLNCFEKYLREIGADLDIIRTITSSLYFSLIPFHDISKSLKFYGKCLEFI